MSKPTPKERGLIKGALRRVFSRSEARRSALARAITKHYDPDRPRVTKWGVCEDCKNKTPAYLLEVDHMVPVVPINSSLEDMSWDDLMERLWCPESNLKILCKACHRAKSSYEMKARRAYKKGRGK